MTKSKKVLIATLAMVALLGLAYVGGDKQRLSYLMDEAVAMVKSLVSSDEVVVETPEVVVPQ